MPDLGRSSWDALALSPGEVVDALMAVHGAVHACVAPGADGVAAAERGSGGDAAAEGLAWSRRTATAFGATVEDLVLTTGEHHHLARTLSGADGAPPDVVYLCVQRGHAPLDTARHELAACLSRLGTLTAPPEEAVPAGRHRVRSADEAGAPAARAAVADPAAVDPVLTLSWAEDVETVRRLLAALTRL